ncbi:MAG: triose-phosphate isomerase [bacterium]|nr:triose-phosphate isomerase [bacterium]
MPNFLEPNTCYDLEMIVVANWKAYVEEAERAKKLFSLAKRLATKTKVSIVLAPSAPQIGLLAPKNKSKIAFAAQDISLSTGGPHTGEVTAPMFISLGVAYTLVGHSERRAAGETRETVAQKILHAIAHGLTPILCVGEKERDAEGRYLAEVRADIVSALTQVAPKDRSRVIVVYEPVWAIGKGAEDAIAVTDLSEMALYIRKVLAELATSKASSKTIVLYGGSVVPEDIRGLAGGSGVDGFLVGHASVDPSMFTALVKALAP